MKKIVTILLLILSVTAYSQGNSPWRSYFSYNNVIDITQSASRVYAAADQAVFSKNLLTNELKTITSVDGLKAETITAIHHSTAFNRTLIGNANGLLLIVNADNTIVSRVDIIEETTVQANKKRINHIYEYDGKAYISTDFGIAVFDIAAMEFGDTFYLGPNGAEIPVLQCTVYNNYIYAASLQYGLRKADITNPNLNDYSQWVVEHGGNWVGIMTFNGSLFGAYIGGTIFRNVGGNYNFFASMPSEIVDFDQSGGYMYVTSKEKVSVFNDQFFPQAQINIVPCADGEPVNFTCAGVLNDQLFIGTQEKGVYATHITNLGVCENITPDGPIRSNIFSLEKTSNNLWAVYGDYSYGYDPHPLEQLGISKLTPEGWQNINNQQLFNAASIVDIVAKPNNQNEVYAASFHSGLIKVVDDVPVDIYDHTDNINHGPESLPPPGNNPTYRSVRINSLAFDRQNNLWMTNSLVENALKVLKPDGQWAEYSFEDISVDPMEESYDKMVIDKNGTKWIPSINSGLIAFNERIDKVLVLNDDNNLPSTYVRCVAIDNRNHLWIGTSKGLRVLRGVDRFMTEDDLATNQIIIMEDGRAQELLYEQFISVIKVDGANNKWIGTSNAGAFLVSPDGQQTLFRFTKANSPLPSNNINDIEIDPATGEVFIATDKGMVSYKGTSTGASDNLNNVYVFPNPVRPGFEGDVNISGLIDKANVKITDIEGNLVYEITSEGGTVLWNQKAFGRHKVASGVYMIFISSEDGTETKVKKVMIIR